MTVSYRVLTVDSVDIIACFIALLEVVTLTCVEFSSFTRDTGFNDVLVHGFVCVQ